jgi:hypothetical protein
MVTLAFSTRLSGFTTPALAIAKGVDCAAFGKTANPAAPTKAPQRITVSILWRPIAFI